MRRFTKFVWLVLVYDVLVVLWGAYVRASFSGDGCGAHWPLCNGEIVPHAQQTKTIVELSHRVSSGGSLVLAVVLFVWARGLRSEAERDEASGSARGEAPRTGQSITSKGSLVRRWAGWVLAFTASEALIGAGLVLLRLVAHDVSLRRGVSTGLHLTNTFVLLASLAITARVSTGAPPITFRGRGWLGALAFAALAGVILVGATGSIAALGDTLYPSHSVAQGLAQDVAPSAPVFIRLRSLHPFVAIGVGVLLLALATLAPIVRPTPHVQRFARALSVAFFVQLGLGAINIMLLAPTWLQLLHLLSADVVWVLLVLLATAATGEESPTSSPAGALAGSPPAR